MSESAARPRYVSDAAWPPYAFVPGRGLPHPVNDRDGHLFGTTPEIARIDADRWQDCRLCLRGIDLFNYGFYWESHGLRLFSERFRSHRTSPLMLPRKKVQMDELRRMLAGGVKLKVIARRLGTNRQTLFRRLQQPVVLMVRTRKRTTVLAGRYYGR